MADPEWETSKENVAPLRAGRDVQVLNKALTTSKDQREIQRLTREEQVRDAIAGHGPRKDDPLEAWSTYTKWIVENYPSGSEVLIRAVEEVCRMYAKSDRYRDDIRLVRLWIRYIDLRQDKLDAFNYMNRRKIGQSWSLFYEAWAITLEIARQYDEAERVYRTGRERQAKPVERLAQREREYYNRMAARRRRDEKKKLEAETKRITQSHREEARKVRESSRAASSLANTVLSETGPNDRSTHDARGHKVRPALGQINEAQAKSGRRPFVLERNQSRVGTTRQSFSQTQRENHNPKPQKFEIYADRDTNASPAMTGMPHSLTTTEEDIPPIPELVKREDLRKEDEGRLPSKWSGHTLPQESTLRSKLKRGSSRPFEVYQDPGNLSSPSDPIVEAAIRDVHESRSVHVDSFDDILQRSTVPQKTAARTNATSWIRDTTDGSGSPTINTKLAMKEVDDIFNSSHSMEMESDSDVLRNPVVQSLRGKALKGGTIETSEYVRHGTEKGSSLEKYSRPEMAPDADEQLRKENRVLRPLSEFEGSSVHTSRRSQKANDAVYETSLLDISQKPRLQKDASSQLQDSNEYDMTEFLASWCYNDSQFQLLEDADPEVSADDMFDLQCRQGPVSFNVDKFQWAGCLGHSYVVLADDLNNSFGLMNGSQETGSEDDDFKVVAIKVSRSSNAWEYYIYKTIHSRLSTATSSIPQAISFCEGNPRSYLILDSCSNCSLQQAENLFGEKKLPESLSMFFAASILRVLADLHAVDIIHSDVTLDNVLFRYDLNSDISKHPYSETGEAGWSRWGVLLVDFNHSIDARHPEVSHMDTISLAGHVAKQGNLFQQEEYRITNAESWAYNGDCYSASICAARMLGICGSDFRSQLSELQHTSIWENFFFKMEELHASSTARQTCEAMRSCRIEMEEVLRADRMLPISLMQLVNHIVDADNEDMTKGF